MRSACSSSSDRPTMTCPSCGVRMCQSELTSVVFLIHEPADTHEVLTALRCPLFGASQSLTIPATVAPEQKGLSKDEVLTNVWLRKWARTW